jgi:hypothetical protein
MELRLLDSHATTGAAWASTKPRSIHVSGEGIVGHAVHADCWPLTQVPVSGSPPIGPYGGRCLAKGVAELGLLAELAELSANPVDHEVSSIGNMCWQMKDGRDAVSPISAKWAPLWRMLRSPDQLGSDGQIVDTQAQSCAIRRPGSAQGRGHGKCTRRIPSCPKCAADRRERKHVKINLVRKSSRLRPCRTQARVFRPAMHQP